MAKLFYHDNNISVSYYCPACNKIHTLNKTWNIKDDDGIINISPSILVTGTSEIFPEKNTVCHSFIKNNKIEYLNDCTHKYAGRIIDLPDDIENRI